MGRGGYSTLPGREGNRNSRAGCSLPSGAARFPAALPNDLPRPPSPTTPGQFHGRSTAAGRPSPGGDGRPFSHPAGGYRPTGVITPAPVPVVVNTPDDPEVLGWKAKMLWYEPISPLSSRLKPTTRSRGAMTRAK